MAEYGEWNRKGAALSDVTAQKEYGVTRDFIVKGIQAGKLEFREGAVWGNPYLRVLRSQLELYTAAQLGSEYLVIPRSRHDPKILWVDDAEIVGDRITKVRPIPRDLFTQKTERRIGELGASCVALVVSDVSVHEAP